MEAKIYRLMHPKNYHELFLEKGIRADERSYLESRLLTVSYDKSEIVHGSSKVVMGNTKVFCNIKAEPSLAKPGDNVVDFINVQVNFPFVNSQSLRSNQTLDQTQIANFYLQNFIQSSEVLKVEDLTDCDGKLYWKLDCELIVVEDDGSLYDVCSIALLAALKNVKLPTASIEASSVQEGGYKLDDAEKRSLRLRGMPVMLTFVTWNEDILLVDPTKDEEDLGNGVITITYDNNSDCFNILKSSGCALEAGVLDKCFLQVKKRSEKVFDVLQ